MCQVSPEIIVICILSVCLSLFLLLYLKKSHLLKVIRRSRDRFKALVDLSPYGIALTSRSGRIISVNRALADLLGRDVRCMVGGSLPGLLGLDTMDVMERSSRLGAGEILKLSEIDLENTSGRVLHLRPCLFRDEDSGDMLFWHVQDRTTYFELEKRFQELSESVPVGLFWAGMDGKIGAVNPEFNKIFSRGPLPGTLAELLTEKGWNEAIKEILTAGNVFETGIELDDGCHVKYLKVGIKLSRNAPSRYLAGIVKDVTVEKKLQQELESAYEKAEAASRAKSTFLSEMSHEFRTPLNVIQGMATILEDRITDREALGLVSDLKTASEHLAALIGDILDLAKIESGKLSIDSTPFDMKELLEGVERVLGVQAGLKDLDFRIILPEDVHRYYMGDPVRIRQIIFNLAGNAIKLTRKGSVEVAVSTADMEVGKNRKRLAISVKDTGPGIPEELLSGLFSPFVQAEEGRRAGGTGLGLSIAKELAELMGGSIKVSSRVGEGTVFIVEIGLEPIDSGMVPEKSGEADLHLEPGMALIADDVAMNRKILCMFLEKKGWQVREASNGKEVLAVLEEVDDFDIVLMDVSMPEMDGVEAAMLIKANKAWSTIPVIAVTAHAMSEDRQRFLDAGMDGYVSKPVKQAELFAEMRRVLPQKRTRPEKDNQGPKLCQDGNSMAAMGLGSSAHEKGAPVEYKRLLKTCQGMEDLAKELLKDIINECPKWVEKARRAVETSDPVEIRRVCHLIRGSASTVHADELSKAAESLGQAAREGNAELYSDRLCFLQQAASHLEQWVKANISFRDAIERLQGLSVKASSLHGNRWRA